MSVYAISDLHGRLDLYKAVQDFLKPEDKVFCLGDCGDRGPQSWETIKAVASNPQWTYLMGNHEHMLAGAMCEYLDDIRLSQFIESYGDKSMITLLASNGGQDTLDSWINEGANPDWITYLLNLKMIKKYGDIILCHAGFTPITDYTCPDLFDLLWDRSHFYEELQLSNYIVVHGHTPCQILSSKWTIEDGAFRYCNGFKIDIDVGAYINGATVLLNLDTFDEHIFSI